MTGHNGVEAEDTCGEEAVVGESLKDKYNSWGDNGHSEHREVSAEALKCSWL